MSLLVTRFPSEQRSELQYVGCYHVFLVDDFIWLMRLLSMCKDDPGKATQRPPTLLYLLLSTLVDHVVM